MEMFRLARCAVRRNKLVTHASPSGLTTRRDWGTTVALFTDEYKVSLLCLEAAISTGTVGELILLVLLSAGPLAGVAPAVTRQMMARYN